MSGGAHRDVAPPWVLRVRCWLFGHDIRQTGIRAWCCLRCDRVASTPVELP